MLHLLHRPFVSLCTRYYLPLGVTRADAWVMSTLVAFVAACLLIYLYWYQHPLAELDKRVSLFFSYASDDPLRTTQYPFNTGILSFINSYPIIYLLLPIVKMSACCLLTSGMTRPTFLSLYLYYPGSFFIYGFCVQMTVIVLKLIVRRPRPLHTIDLSAFTEECLLEFRALFSPKFTNNTCRYHLSSTPSGHTATAMGCVLASLVYTCTLLMTLLSHREIEKEIKKPHLVLIICFTFLVGLEAYLTIPLVVMMALARMSAGAHYLSDTLAGAMVAILHLPLLILTFPDIKRMHNENGYAICIDSQGSCR
ncbi:PAP2 superfamily protein [Giardia muris]|uniref:PAP2 superfamily protein n=1 Tax=Giardia muris TaxID=5742 RepID=A0A4Z1TBK3_GIAMU|nr:PAP2 superfamily protein [Giardia muris]|eukprot:TNJ30627.1 PAP2 superfamily protein [Giardia muris]